MRKIIILIVLYALLIVLGLRFRPAPMVNNAMSLAETTKQTEKIEGSEDKPIYVKLDPIVVNMLDPKSGSASTRAAKIGITVQVKTLETANKFKRQTVQTRDCLLSILSTYTAERLKDPAEQLKLKDELIMRLQGIVGENSIININISELIVG